jgi:hypothetical protein
MKAPKRNTGRCHQHARAIGRAIGNASFYAIAATLFLVAGCTGQVVLMPRDSGKTYSGVMKSNGMGSGTISVTIDGAVFSGPIVRVGSNGTFGFASAYGTTNKGATATAFGTYASEGDRFAKAILSDGNGHGLRCDMRGQSHGGGGICVDDNGKVYDILVVVQ